MLHAPPIQFDCPACGDSLWMSHSDRGELLRCRHCGVHFPAPEFWFNRFDPLPPVAGRVYRCPCRVCDGVVEVREEFVGREVLCAHCRQTFRQPPPEWERWRRPVAKFFSAADRRRSLHHLMLSREYAARPDELVEPRYRRRFEFYCGACGQLQQARVWDIAGQQPCRFCDALLIVPSPRWRSVPSAAALVPIRELASREFSGSLHCPQCGRVITPADRSREHKTHCPSCDIWF